ncbi:MAG: hypothetical protein ABSD27_08890 [Bryobacteraceae bacterium]
MKRLLCTPAMLVSMVFSIGCAKAPAPAKKDAGDDDRTELLLRHLVHRVDELRDALGKSRNETLAHDNRCLEDQIAELEGHPVHHPRYDPAASARKLAADLDSDLESMAIDLLDSQAVTEYHNRHHPEAPWDDRDDALRLLCGDCSKERAARDAKIVSELRTPGTAGPAH